MEFAQNKPSVKVLNKLDLADEKIVQQWQQHLEQNSNIKTIALTTKQPDKLKQILELARKLVPNKSNHQFISAMIMGIPNVGKSTIINILANRIVAKTGNEPAVTKGQQRIKISDDIVFFDTPGMLWPKIGHELWALRLATTGAIKETAMTHEDCAFYLVAYLMKYYPDRLKNRFELSELADDEYSVLEQIGARRGCLRSKNMLDLHKVSSILIHEYRSGNLGGICLEQPEFIELEIQQAIEQEQIQAVKREARKKRRKKSKN
jgi:ribosome biogenesis GTPase A